MIENETDKDAPPKWLSPLLDYGPLLLFFVTNWWFGSKEDPARGPLISTAVFMVAIIAALIVSKWKLGKVSPMMWVSAVLVTGFGALTLWFRDPQFIQIKPTLIYLLFAAILFGGLLRGKALLQNLLAYAFDGVDDKGWIKLSRNWAIFFLAMAGLNEIIRQDRWFSFDTWLLLKVWGVTALFFLFNMTQIPMLMRHGLKLGEDDSEDQT
ncbi:inner membrane-spanning protein YciB [Sphingorhabdus arenilitoris]|uniref:Inner membrane-spanning protein YciB n=1 Tax=Sphingorhabdus arenilitoris TaxID=1490041 RepID=A0ABV8RHI7_9SPHN